MCAVAACVAAVSVVHFRLNLLLQHLDRGLQRWLEIRRDDEFHLSSIGGCVVAIVDLGNVGLQEGAQRWGRFGTFFWTPQLALGVRNGRGGRVCFTLVTTAVV